MKDYDAQFARIREITGCTTQTEIAAFLGIRQSSVSDAKKRSSIPDSWKMEIARKLNVNPLWIETGKEPRYL